ncbi:MAG TPA: twin-arginine translocation signal domain-containing protein [Terriglobia bacterium]|nr:twin-arginine translocation signal domain-containing protein [Terriglobia bacterium]
MSQRDSMLRKQSGLSRRRFLGAIGASTAAATVGPTLLLASKGRGKPVVLGSGRHTYEIVPGWGRLPAGVKYGYTHGVQVDSHNHIIVHNQSKDAVMIFDHKGKFIKSWGPDFQKGAHGCLLRKESGTEYLYLSDYERHIVVKATVDGEIVWTLTYPKDSGVYKTEAEFKPTNVAIAPNGDMYVADGYGLSYVHQYNSKLERIRTWGGKGSEPGKLDCPHGIWVDTRGSEPQLVVADRSNARLQYFTLDGKHLGFVKDAMRRPCHFDQANGELLIPDLYGIVTILDQNNKLITTLGDNPGVWEKKGWPNLPDNTWEVGKFISPHAACWDKRGDIYVVEWIAEGRVTKLRRVS